MRSIVNKQIYQTSVACRYRGSERPKSITGALPCLWKGAVRHWPACREWQEDRFAAHLGEEHELLLASSDEVTHGEGGTGGSEVRRTFREWSACAASGLWHFDGSLLDSIPSLQVHYCFNKFGANMYKPFDVLSLSFGAGNGLGFHSHGATLFGLATGIKTWHLLPPEAFRGQETPIAFQEGGGGSEIVLTMEAGDLLYVPPGWYHATVNRSHWTAGVARTSRWRRGERRAIFSQALTKAMKDRANEGQKSDGCRSADSSSRNDDLFALKFELAVETVADEVKGVKAGEGWNSTDALDWGALSFLRAAATNATAMLSDDVGDDLTVPTSDAIRSPGATRSPAALLRQQMAYATALQHLGRHEEAVHAFQAAFLLDQRRRRCGHGSNSRPALGEGATGEFDAGDFSDSANSEGSVNTALLLRLGIAQFEAGDAVSAYTTAEEILKARPGWGFAEQLKDTAAMVKS